MSTRAVMSVVPVATAFARGPFHAGGVVILDEEEAHHLKVRRVADGEAVRLVDGRGAVATARLALEGEVVAARVVATTNVPVPPVTELLVGSGDRERFLALVEKATELGATRIVPLVTERSQQVATRFQALHVEKAAKRAREALKQCGAAWTPAVGSPMALSEVLRPEAPLPPVQPARPGAAPVRLVADPEGEPVGALGEGDAIVWAIGPEGGFTDSEMSAIRAAGFRPAALGRATLRFDTAALAALAVTAAARHSGGDPA